MNKVAIIIPAYNEEQSLTNVLKSIHSLTIDNNNKLKVFVIDDGSTDNTYNIAQYNGAEVVKHPICLGVGGALKTGYTLAENWGADTIVQLDADGEHDPAEIPFFLNYYYDKNVDILIGSRFLNGSPPLSFVRRVGINFFTRLINMLTRYNLTDVTSGYRVINCNILRNIWFPSDKHWAVAMTLLAGKHGLTVEELPIKPTIRKTGKSQFYELMTFVLYPIRIMKQIIDVYL